MDSPFAVEDPAPSGREGESTALRHWPQPAQGSMQAAPGELEEASVGSSFEAGAEDEIYYPDVELEVSRMRSPSVLLEADTPGERLSDPCS